MINDIRLINYRSYTDDTFELSTGVNIVVGPNGSGKTNLLEAVLVLSRGFSYRVNERELIRDKESWFKIIAHTEVNEREFRVETASERSTKTLLINKKPYKRINLERTLPVVLFEPNHLQLFNGGPQLRRDYIDNILEQTSAVFKEQKNKYLRALRQRNAILKNKGNNKELFVWNIRLSQLGGQIIGARTELVNKINEQVSRLYDQISGHGEKIELVYESKISLENYESALLKELEQKTDLDFARGFTGSGVHRDDIVVLINGAEASRVASRGETRSVVLALKVIEAEIVEEFRTQKPIFLLDDVFSELDGSRRVALTKLINGYQSFITTTDADVVIQHFTESARIIPL